MRIFSKAIPVGKFLPLLLVVGIAGSVFTQRDTLSANAQASSAGAEVSVKIIIPAAETLTGTAIITLEDISFQDAPSVELARLEIPASSLTADKASVAVPIDLQTVDSSADITVAILIDSDDSGDASAGDWISNTLALVINNSRMEVSMDVVRINPP